MTGRVITTQRRLRFLARLNPSKSEVSHLQTDTLVTFIPMESVGDRGEVDNSVTRELDEVQTGYTYFRNGDVLVAKITPCFENGKGALARSLVNGVGFGTTELHVIRPGGELDPVFLYYLSASHQFRTGGQASMTGAAGQKRVPEEFIKDFSVPTLGLDLQRRIAAFLDGKTAAIDELVKKKERLIELLQEKRQALITQAVTKGLDPNVPMKAAGVQWIGALPSHWQVKRLMHLTPDSRPIMYGIVLPGPDVDDGIPIVKSGNCTQAKLRLDELSRTTAEIEAPYARARLQPDDIVYAIRGSIGMAAIVPPELRGANLTQDAARIAPRHSVNSKWLLYAVQAHPVWSQLQAGVLGATVKGINIRDLKRPWLPVPPSSEQSAIAEYLDDQVQHLDALTKATEASCEVLIEYRQALISSAVTGQLDVSKEAA